MSAGAAPGAPAGGRFPALDALRGVAVLMVVYDHLFAVAGERMAGGPFSPVPWVREHLTQPLGIIQDFGWFGVCLFFLISGFVITQSARRESGRAFAVRRALRIVPPLAAAIVLVALGDLIDGVRRPFTDYLYGLTLAGYLTEPQIIVLGVAWTLVIEVVFYALMGLVGPLLKSRRPVAGLALATLFPLAVIVCARAFGASFFLFAATVAYLPVLLVGSAIYLRRTGLAGGWSVGLLVLANCAVFMLGLRSIHTAFLPIANSYPVTAVYATALFLLCLGRSAVPRSLKFIGDISYSLYLLHGTLGFFVLQRALAGGFGPVAPLIAAAASLIASYGLYRWVERPSIQAGRRLAA